MEWHRDKAARCYRRGEDVLQVIRRPFGLTFTIMFQKAGEKPRCFGIFPGPKDADRAIKKGLKGKEPEWA